MFDPCINHLVSGQNQTSVSVLMPNTCILMQTVLLSVSLVSLFTDMQVLKAEIESLQRRCEPWSKEDERMWIEHKIPSRTFPHSFIDKGINRMRTTKVFSRGDPALNNKYEVNLQTTFDAESMRMSMA